MNNQQRILAIDRILMVVALCIFIVMMQLGGRESKKDIKTVAAQVVKKIDMEKMNEGTNRIFKKFYGLNANDYEGVALYAPVSNMDAEEILIIKLKNTSQAETVTAAIQKRLEKQKKSFEGYGIEQTALLEKYVLDVRGNYVFYAVHTDADKADKIFRNSL